MGSRAWQDGQVQACVNCFAPGVLRALAPGTYFTGFFRRMPYTRVEVVLGSLSGTGSPRPCAQART